MVTLNVALSLLATMAGVRWTMHTNGQ